MSLKDIHELTKPDGGKYKVNSLSEASDFCRRLALSHYENFPVGSILIPKKSRPHFYAVYAYSRIADDIADESSDSEAALAGLNSFKRMIIHPDSIIGNPIFTALHHTKIELDIPDEPFLKLLHAFRMDIHFRQPDSWDDIFNYCAHSANPVGELVLRIFGQYNQETRSPSDYICTGLQLVNFWQDISRDRKIGRYYIPKSLQHKYNLNNENLAFDKKSGNFKLLLEELFEKTQNLFDNGEKLTGMLKSKRLRAEIAFVLEGGRLILKKCRRYGTRLHDERPKISKFEFFILLNKVLFKYRIFL